MPNWTKPLLANGSVAIAVLAGGLAAAGNHVAVKTRGSGKQLHEQSPASQEWVDILRELIADATPSGPAP